MTRNGRYCEILSDIGKKPARVRISAEIRHENVTAISRTKISHGYVTAPLSPGKCKNPALSQIWAINAISAANSLELEDCSVHATAASSFVHRNVTRGLFVCLHMSQTRDHVQSNVETHVIPTYYTYQSETFGHGGEVPEPQNWQFRPRLRPSISPSSFRQREDPIFFGNASAAVTFHVSC
ncbi:hypothetical protein TcasGA2_TC012355 [Tribolium castaneum]|uniref:Uncharacterized protein n=1 Tax=Tribolium castaneum TaxID=7070 RepID=D6X1U4_TRICA|nr:hypothetical protein TcasGA2_TC012355 [Tribolium castaneum]